MELRPYQEEAKTAVLADWENGRRKTLLVLPTGTGKTIVFSAITAELVRRGERVLIMAHRGELLEQAADKLKSATGLRCAVEKAESTSVDGWERVTVGSVQTLMRTRRLEALGSDRFDTIIIDEAHHAISSSYQQVLNFFSNSKVLGVTATPDRGDMKDLGTYFENIAYEYTLPQAIRDGFLCKIKAQCIPLKIDISDVGVQAGDFQGGALGEALEPYLEEIAVQMERYAKGRKTVVFLPLIKTSQMFAEILNRHGFKACEVNGNSEDRREVLERFAGGEYDVICNSMLLTEGWDCPSVDCIVVLRPTKVRSLYCQMVGRGTRLCEGKEHLLVLDFLWMSDKHSLCRPAALICEDHDQAEVMTRKMAENAGEGAVDIEEAAKEAAEDATAEREAALAKQLAMQRKKKAKLVDPLQFEMSLGARDLISYEPVFPWEMEPVTNGQAETLEKKGINSDEVDCFGKAEKLIKALDERRRDGFTTPKQIRFLESRGFRDVGQWSFESARKMINRIASNNWRVPGGIYAPEYRPE